LPFISLCHFFAPGSSDMQRYASTHRNRMKHIDRVTHVKLYYNLLKLIDFEKLGRSRKIFWNEPTFLRFRILIYLYWIYYSSNIMDPSKFSPFTFAGRLLQRQRYLRRSFQRCRRGRTSHRCRRKRSSPPPSRRTDSSLIIKDINLSQHCDQEFIRTINTDQLRDQVSISSTFYARIFCKQLSLVTFQLCNFWRQNILGYHHEKIIYKIVFNY